MRYTDKALIANVITESEANSLEDYIDDISTSGAVGVFNPPNDLKPLFDKVALFNIGGQNE